jgi:SAM-dependent methyltransferase
MDRRHGNPATIDYDRLAPAYARHRAAHPGIVRALCRTVDAGARVLEVGCGTGNYSRAVREPPLLCAQLSRAWGIDPSIEMLRQARARAPQAHFCQGRAERLGFAAHSFDLAFSVDVIHHVGDRLAYCGEAYRVLARGGCLCTATDSAWIIRHREPLSTYFPETIPYELARYPRIADLEAMMSAVGFVEVRTETTEHVFFTTDIGAYRSRAFSALRLISEGAFDRGIAQMERDLEHGPIRCTPRYALVWGIKG